MTESKTEIAEVPEAEMIIPATKEVEPETQPLSTANMDGMIQVASKIESYAKSMDIIIGTIIKRAFEGDFTCHDRSSTPENERKANMGSAAAERIACFLGICEKGWEAWKEKTDDGKHYTWFHKAYFSLGNRTIYAVGSAGTRDKFFSYADGQYKPLDEVNEDYIRTASRRACKKNGVREILGLRNVPITRLQALGFDPKKIKMVNFSEKIAASEKATGSAATGGLIMRNIQIFKIEKTEGVGKDSVKEGKIVKGRPWTRWDVFDAKGIKHTLFADHTSRRVVKLQDCCEDQTAITIGIQIKEFNGQEQYQIVTVEGVEET